MTKKLLKKLAVGLLAVEKLAEGLLAVEKLAV